LCGADLYIIAAWEWGKNGMERKQLVIEAEGEKLNREADKKGSNKRVSGR
jgi:hypothetical protein